MQANQEGLQDHARRRGPARRWELGKERKNSLVTRLIFERWPEQRG